MSSFSQEFSSTSTSRTMEVDIDHNRQTQRQLKVPSASQTAYGATLTVPAHHDQENKPGLSVPCNVSINGGPLIQNRANNGNNLIDHQAFFDSLPPGYRFRPTKEELIKYYLLPKINGETLPPSHIRDVNLYERGPDKITEDYEAAENEWYFFTPRDRKYPNGDRPNRAAGTGYWKATGADVKIKDNDKSTIGFKKSLVYHEGKAPNGEKTDWIMHEYRANATDKPKARVNMRLDDYVLCRIYKKNDNRILKGRQEETFQETANNTTGVDDSSRLMNSHQDTPLMDAASGPVKFSSHLPATVVAPPNFGQFSADQNMNASMQDNITYQPSEWDFWYPKFEDEFDLPLLDLDYILVPKDDDIPPPSSM